MNHPETVMQSMEEIRLLTVGEAAEIMGISVQKLRERLSAGELDYLEWGNEKRIPYWLLKEWQREHLKKTQIARSAALLFRHPESDRKRKKR